ncbi:hypothetical protein AGMMS50293_01890 [Spirochaetia bacterium]|nr:hypothetical protein AGMMS50293_01890 [Spirochaetia bacterium]
MNKIQKILTITIIGAVLLTLVGCNDPVSFAELHGGGGVIITLPGSPAHNTAVRAALSDPVINAMSYTITCTDPKGEVKREEGRGGSTATISLNPGSWHISIDAKYNEHFAGHGEADVVVVAGKYNSVLVPMTVEPDFVKPVISIQPTGADYGLGDSAEPLTVTAIVLDDAVLSYQWYENGANSNSGGTPISGAITNSFTPPTGSPSTIWYYVEVSRIDPAHTVTSETAKIIVSNLVNITPIIITGNLTGATYSQNATATSLTITAIGGGDTLHYQWYSNGLNTTIGGTTVGTDSPSFTPPTNEEGTIYYYCVVTSTISDNGDGGQKTATTTSAVAKIEVNNLENALPPAISVQPQGATYALGQTASLSVTASVTDGGTLSYQWYSNGSDTTTGGTAIGTDSSSFTSPTNSAGTVYYYCVITNTISDNGDGGQKTAATTSAVAKIEVNNLENALPPAISVQPQGATYALGQIASLSVTASVTDGGTLSYQWYSNGSDTTTGGTAIGTDSSSFTPPTNSAGAVYYYCVITNTISDNGDGGQKTATTTSDVAAITVKTLQDRIADANTAGGTHTLLVYQDENFAGFSPATETSGNITNSTVDITLKGIGAERTITLSSGGFIFYITDGALTLDENVTLKGISSNTNRLVHIHKGSLTMKLGSKISNNPKGGVYIGGDGIFTMNGGTISDNTGHSAVYVDGYGPTTADHGGLFTMNGGTISGNTYSQGAGVFIAAGSGKPGKFIMNGGTISSNTATSGGGVYIYSSGTTFTMTGGTITGNTAPTGSGVYAGGPFTMSGSAVVHSSNDVYLTSSSRRIEIGDNLTETAPVATITPNSYSPGSTTLLSGSLVGNYDKFAVTPNGGNTYTIGADGKLANTSAILLGSTYYLTLQAAVNASNGSSDSPDTITLLGDITILSADVVTINSGKHVRLVPGGSADQTITRGASGFGSLFTVDSGASLTLGENSPVQDLIIDGGSTASRTATEALITVNGTLTMNPSVTLQNNNNTSGDGGGVYVDINGVFTMNNGATISGNTADNGGGGVYVDTDGVFTMNNGATISGNTADNGGGGVNVYEGTFTMNGGIISGNNATYDGGGVNVYGGTFTMLGGTIEDNGAGNYGGGVYLSSETFTMSGGRIYGSDGASVSPLGVPNRASTGGKTIYVSTLGSAKYGDNLNTNILPYTDAHERYTDLTITGHE